MEYVNNVNLKGDYTTKAERINVNKKRWTSKIVEKINNHKTISIIAFFFIAFSLINIIMISNMLLILKTL